MPVLVFLALITGCAKAPESAVTPNGADPDITASPKATTAWPTDIKIHKNADGKVVCPVMNSTIDSPDKAVSYEDYKGVRYYICCDGCPEKFRADPEKYAEKAVSKAKAPQ